MKLSRREFVASTSAAALVTGESARARGRVAPPSDRLRGGFIGTGGMGRANLRDFLRMDDVQVAAVCDVWEHNRGLARTMTEGQQSGPATGYADFREILDRKDIDFVVVSTPDHWHALPTILACQAGKDVYVEKPLAHNVYEGRRMVEAARSHGRVVQVGTQQRSGDHYKEVVGLIREGAIGKIGCVRAWNFENDTPRGMGKPADMAPPEGLDWDFWLGPAPVVAFNPNRFIGTFRWYWDYSGGKLTDWGTHHIDIVHWAMNVDAPRSVCMMGGQYVLDDNRETPDTVEAVFEYDGFLLTYSTRVGNARDPVRWGYGIEFFGSDGTLFIDRDGYEIYPETDGNFSEPVPSFKSQLASSQAPPPPPWKRSRRNRKGRCEYVIGEGSEQHLSHVRNFLDCVKSREKPVSDVEIGHRSTTAPHLANISYHTGRRVFWDAKKEQILNDVEANSLLKRKYRSPWEV